VSEIIIAGEIYIDPSRREECLAAGLGFQAATRRDEPGCLAYVFSADPVAPGTICVYERWADAPSLEAHFLHQNYFDMRAVFGAHGVTGTKISKFRLDAEDSVYVDGKATASFPDERS
jgi:quinol monooxygenase YgiN